MRVHSDSMNVYMHNADLNTIPAEDIRKKLIVNNYTGLGSDQRQFASKVLDEISYYQQDHVYTTDGSMNELQKILLDDEHCHHRTSLHQTKVTVNKVHKLINNIFLVKYPLVEKMTYLLVLLPQNQVMKIPIADMARLKMNGKHFNKDYLQHLFYLDPFNSSSGN